MATMSLGSGFIHEEEEVEGRTMKYLPINRLYSSTSPCINPSGSSSVMSKKVKARQLVDEEEEGDEEQEEKKALKTPVLVYRRRRKKPRPGRDEVSGGIDRQSCDSDGNAVTKSGKKTRKNYELLSLDSSGIGGPRLRGSGGLSSSKGEDSGIRKRGRTAKDSSALYTTKRWVE